MNPCQNCGKLNAAESHFCRFCGTRMTAPQQVIAQNPYDQPQPQPYGWKTDEFSTQSESRKTNATGHIHSQTSQFDAQSPQYRPAPLAYQQPQQFAQPFRCPHCSSQMVPRIERRISTAGWVTFAVLLVVFFPLFWIGLLIKEDVPVCLACNSKLQIGPHR